ncbi:MAG: ABC transporter substrate-binding protein [Geminicoccaceae bacterium]
MTAFRAMATNGVRHVGAVVCLACLPILGPAVADDTGFVPATTIATTAAKGDRHTGDAENERPILIGLNATLSGSVGQSGRAIKRGLRLAIDEVNAAGGVLGRRLEIIEDDNRGIPARGVDIIDDFAKLDNLVAIVGGIHSPVASASLKAIHKHGIVYLGPWAASTPVVDNGYRPNYVFRVSARDEFAGGFLIDTALKRGFRRPGLLLWRTGWGRSNEKAMTTALRRTKTEPAGTQWFNTSQRDISDQIDKLVSAGADVIMLVANASEGLTVFRNMAARPLEKRVPIISHWGITGGNLFKRDPTVFEKIDLTFLQTYSFFEPPFRKKSARLLEAYCAKYRDCGSPAAVFSPVGTAHAYDLVHLLKRAIEKAGSTDRAKVRDALERLDRYDGLVRVYDPAFTPDRHDALNVSDFRLCRYDGRGAIVPIGSELN